MFVQLSEELLAKYAGLGTQVGEFLVVTLVLYLPGRLVLEPAIAWLLARRGFEPTLERALLKVVHVTVAVGAVGIGAAAAGFGSALGGSALIVAAGTVAVGFAAQDVISNFVAGVFIVQDRNFNNETITVPNTELATTSVTNRMSKPRLRITYPFGIGYGDDVDTAMEILLSAAADHDEILADPEPSVRVTDLADAAVLLQARFWIADPDREDFSETPSEYIQTVAERCRDAAIDLSTTTQHDISGELSIEDAPVAGD